MSDEVIISKKLLQIVFDTAINSMDFGSGFLDNEEVEALREIAVILGIDQMVATPDPFKCQYGYHNYATEDSAHTWTPLAFKKGQCYRCLKNSSSV